jgi:hypothetical protein
MPTDNQRPEFPLKSLILALLFLTGCQESPAGQL